MASDFGLGVSFAPSQVIGTERPLRRGYAIEHIGAPGNPFAATLGLRVEPGAADSGITFHRPSGALPLAFYKAIEETVHDTLREGLSGWEVREVIVTVTETAYASPVTVAGDFRKLTPLVLMGALKLARTRVCEPVASFELDAPSDMVGETLAALVGSRAVPEMTLPVGSSVRISGTIPTDEVNGFEQRVPGLTRGVGVLTTTFAGYAPVDGEVPDRERSAHDPLNREWYLAKVSQM